MIDYYLYKIENDGWTIDNVPKLWRNRVAAALAAKTDASSTEGIDT